MREVAHGNSGDVIDPDALLIRARNEWRISEMHLVGCLFPPIFHIFLSILYGCIGADGLDEEHKEIGYCEDLRDSKAFQTHRICSNQMRNIL